MQASPTIDIIFFAQQLKIEQMFIAPEKNVHKTCGYNHNMSLCREEVRKT
jgi:citrate lyase synthetase